ncbi:MAG: type IV secretion system DNA-binding domain-containing protein [Hyphomicrobium sp.]
MNAFKPIVLGRGTNHPFELSRVDLRRHFYMLGKTGSGKTTLMHNMAVQDLEVGHGLALIDPHGDEAERLLDYVPKARTNDTIYFNPGDQDHCVGLNVLEDVPQAARAFVASGVLAAFESIWRASWGPRLEHFLRNAVLALMDTPEATLLGVPMMFLSTDYREHVMTRITNPIVRLFWEQEYAGYPTTYVREAIGPVLNKMEAFLVYPAIANIVGHPKSTFDMRAIMDGRGVLICNLAKGIIGEDAANLLGSLLVTKIHQSAMSRADQPEDQRIDFTLYVDEFQSFTTDTFASSLAEARKYRLSLVLANQYLEQLLPAVRAAVLGNVGTLVAFRASAIDVTQHLERELYPIQFQHIVELAPYEAWVKSPNRAETEHLDTLPPNPPSGDRAHKVIAQSRRRFTRPRSEAEAAILAQIALGDRSENGGSTSA